MAQSKANRIDGMDGMRFVMCVGIVINHFIPYFFSVDEAGHRMSRHFAYFTDIFFIISGFFLTRSWLYSEKIHKSYKTFVLLRLARIYPLYFVCLFFYIMIAVAAAMGYITPGNPERYELSKLWPHILLMQSWGFADSRAFNYVTWSLSALWLLYLILPPVLSFVRERAWMLWIPIILLIIGGEFYLQGLCGMHLASAQDCDIGILRAAPSFFFFGVWLATVRSFTVPRPVVISGLVLFLVMLFVPFVLVSPIRYVLLYGFIYCLLASDQMGMKTPLSWKPIMHMARYSYGIYLVHAIVATVGITFILFGALEFERYLTSEWASLYIGAALIVLVAVTLIGAVLAYHLIEIPVNKYLQRRILMTQKSG